MVDTAQILKYLQQAIEVKREDVARAKQFVMKQALSSVQGIADRWLAEQKATPPSTLFTSSEEYQPSLESLGKSICLRFALYQAVWELISSGMIVAVGKYATWEPQVNYDTAGGGYSSSARGGIPLPSITFPYVTEIFRLPGADRVPADTDIFLHGINCSTLHPGIREAIDQALGCFRRGLYMPATAMLAAAAEATWIECGVKVAAKLANTKLEGIVGDPYASISKKVTDIKKALEAGDAKSLLKLADRSVADVVSAEVWTTALRERRNALHWDKAKSFLADQSETGTLLMSAPQHLGTLETIRAAC